MKPKPAQSTSAKIEKLIADEAPTAAVIKAALAAEKKEADEKKVNEVRAQLRDIDTIIESSVADVRKIRKAEKVAVARLTALNGAKEEFMKNGDYEAFNKAYAKAQVLRFS